MNIFEKYKFIGITGVIGSGKSFVAQSLKDQYCANIIEIDDIRRDLLWNCLSPLAVSLRQELIRIFDIKAFDEDFFFDRSSFTDYIFSDSLLLKKFNLICFPYFKEEINHRFVSDKLNLLVWVNLIEDNYFTLVEHVILVHISETVWLERNLSHLKDMQARLKLQSNAEEKQLLLHSLLISHEVLNNE